MSVWQRLRRTLGYLDHSVTVVVFTVPEERLRELDVATGPCVPLPGRRRPLVGPLRQDGGEYPRHAAALYTVLTGRPAAGALHLVQQQGRGALYVCSQPFLAAMADASRLLTRLAEEDEVRGEKDLPSFFAKRAEWDRTWLRLGDWPRDVESTAARLDRLHWAAEAGERGHPLYVWHGPYVETSTVHASQRGDGGSGVPFR